jgi:hypothetical protein
MLHNMLSKIAGLDGEEVLGPFLFGTVEIHPRPCPRGNQWHTGKVAKSFAQSHFATIPI